MSVDPTVSSSISSSSATMQASSSTQSADNSKKANSDTSFKDEMNKVSDAEVKKDDKKDNKVEEAKDKVSSDKDISESDKTKDNVDTQNNKDTLQGQVSIDKDLEGVDYSKFGSLALNNANKMLAGDIQRMINNTVGVSQIYGDKSVSANIFSFGQSSDNTISMTQSDAEFFINLTQNDNVSAQKLVAQAQNMLNRGVEATEVKQNVKISEALLNAINTAKETNQPLRIDFDQNMSVILRINKEGAIAANFIPGDKAVEQYLRNNIESLKATFREEDLPYTDLSYSNSSKEQNEKRRNKQQGDK